jgi:regulatory protein
MEMALDLLSGQAYTEKNLKKRLMKAGFEEAKVNDCLARLKNWGYLDDRNYCIHRIESLKLKLKSRLFVENDLLSNGSAVNLVNELLSEYYPEEIEYEIASKLLEKKNSVSKRLEQKWAFLIRAGFSENTVHRCFPDVYPP